jgi:hypothetical protein
MPATVEVGLTVQNDRYDDDDPRWRDQVADLLHDLRRETGSLESRRTPVAGTKGTVDQVILALGSAGVFTLAVDILRAWLARDKHRAVEMTVTGADGRTHTVRVTAENAGADALEPLIEAAASLSREGR